MTDEEADDLLRNNDWAKWSDARWLLREAAAIGARQERERLIASGKLQPSQQEKTCKSNCAT